MPHRPFVPPLGIRLWPESGRSKRQPHTEGYLYSLLEHSADAYRFTALVNGDRIRELFQRFARQLNNEAFLILEYYPEEEQEVLSEEEADRAQPRIYYSPYLPVDQILQTLDPYFERLVHDGFVGFGLANNRTGAELFYSEEKVLTCFSGHHLRVTNLFSQLGVRYNPRQEFPSDLGHDHLSLLCHERDQLPPELARFDEAALDYVNFCGELVDALEMYPVEETLSFFFSEREQDQIAARLKEDQEMAEFVDDDFGGLLLDWDDFVEECVAGFEGDLWDYRLGLRLRDAIEFVAAGVGSPLGKKIREIVADADDNFRKVLTDQRKRLDAGEGQRAESPFWYHGVVRNQGVPLRRDLIRHGWFKP